MPGNNAQDSPKPETGAGKGQTEKPKDPFIIRSFPEGLGSSNDLPYVTIKIFETKTGTYESSDTFSSTFRAGTQRLYQGFDTAISSDVGKGAVVGGLLGGTIGAAALGGIAGYFADDIAKAANSTLDNLFLTKDVDYVSQAKNQIKNFSLKRNEAQLSGMIALFMPEGMTATYDQEYEPISITQALGAVGFVAQAAGSAQTSKTGSVNGTNPYLAEGAMLALSKLGGGNEQLSKIGVFAQTGTVVNPQIELLYTSPTLRKFTLDFRLVPRNKNEAALLFGSIDRGADGKAASGEYYLPDMGIITMLKYFSAPKIVENVGGRYFVPPAQFQLEFKHYDFDRNGHRVNQNLFKTKNCVLESVNLDYGPNGFATYRDGVPVEVRMQLTFQETVMLDRTAILQGY